MATGDGGVGKGGGYLNNGWGEGIGGIEGGMGGMEGMGGMGGMGGSAA